MTNPVTKCSSCGSAVTGKFCTNCGAAAPAETGEHPGAAARETVDLEPRRARAVRDGVAGAVLIGVLDLVGGLPYVDPAAPFIEDGFIADFWWLLIHVSIYLGLAYGLWKRSRAAAIGLVGWQLISTPWPWWVYEGVKPSWLWFWVALVLVALFVRAARATFVIKKLSRRPQGSA